MNKTHKLMLREYSVLTMFYVVSPGSASGVRAQKN